MKLGMIGLGKMGANMAKRLLNHGHAVVGMNRSYDVVTKLAEESKLTPAKDYQELLSKLDTKKIVWLMLPAGEVTDQAIDDLLPHLKAGDILIDGGNSNFKDSIRRSEKLKAKSIFFLDIGTSGGIWGLEKGYCLMAGGAKEAFDFIEPILKDLSSKDGYLYAGASGAGHYVKMIHNGIEYGLMQAYAEGFDILEHSQFDLDLKAISHLWNQGSVVRSWLLELTERIFDQDPKLETLKGFVPDSGEGRWTVQESIDLSVPAPVITLSLQARFRSRRENTFADRYLSALRNQFGGHAVTKTEN